MTARRDGRRSEDAAPRKSSDHEFDDALRDAVDENEATSCEDADAGAFLERFPAAAREPQRPKEN